MVKNLEPALGREAQQMVRDWIICSHGTPSDPESVAFWDRNILLFDSDRMADENGSSGAFGVACEGIYDWPMDCWADIGGDLLAKGVHIESVTGWLLGIYAAS